jgi:hypothetical protein
MSRVVRVILCLASVAAVVLPVPGQALDRTQLAVIVNTFDPLSVRIGEYYAMRRRISFQNLIKVSFPGTKSALTQAEFEAVKAQVDRQTLPNV